MEKDKMERDKNSCWITIHQVCGDCGRRIKQEIDIPEENDNEAIKTFKAVVVKCYGTKFNMACSKCSMKNN